MELPKITQDRIKDDSEKAISKQKNQLALNETYMEGYEDGYIAGATAENERAQKMVEALEFVKANGLCSETTDLINEAIQQWNAGKVVEKEKEPLIPIAVYKQQGCNMSNSRPCPHCGKELSRDRNLCCRECGEEVNNV